MPAQPSSTSPTDLPLDLAAALAAESADQAAPTNRAARRARGRSGGPLVSEQARYQPPAHARPQQGRRINPVRRSG